MSYSTYILTNYNKTVLYTGVTNNLNQRLAEHFFGKAGNFTKRYDVYYLIYYEHHKFINDAIAREKQIKDWNRKKKEALIASFNPTWKFLNESLLGEWPPKNFQPRGRR